MSKEKSKKKASDKKKPQHTLKEKRQLKKKKRLSNTLTKRNSEGVRLDSRSVASRVSDWSMDSPEYAVALCAVFLSISANIPIEGLVADGKII